MTDRISKSQMIALRMTLQLVNVLTTGRWDDLRDGALELANFAAQRAKREQ